MVNIQVPETEQTQQHMQEVSPPNRGKLYTGIMIFVFLLIAIPLYTMILTSRMQSVKRYVTNFTPPIQKITPTILPRPSIVIPQKKLAVISPKLINPVVITQPKDVDNLVAIINNIDTVSIENNLTQFASSASTLQ